MTREQKDKILKKLAEERNYFARECENRIAAEQGKITGADYMIHRFLDVLNLEVEPQESENKTESAYDKCPICINRNKNCQFGSLDCHFKEQIDVTESEDKDENTN